MYQIKNIFEKEVSDEIINRINQLSNTQNPLWGKMSVDQMLAHCNVTYSYTYEPEQYKKPNVFKRFLLKNLVKGIVVGQKPFSKNGQTAPDFIINGNKNFDSEKSKLIENIIKTQQLGESYFDGKENFSFGIMTKQEWNTMFYKHLDHHLNQFGV